MMLSEVCSSDSVIGSVKNLGVPDSVAITFWPLPPMTIDAMLRQNLSFQWLDVWRMAIGKAVGLNDGLGNTMSTQQT